MAYINWLSLLIRVDQVLNITQSKNERPTTLFGFGLDEDVSVRDNEIGGCRS
jgi:hypothetical protein